MSRRELERLVGEAEANASLRKDLQCCRSGQEIVLTARRLGYRLTGKDLQRAWWEERLERGVGRNADRESSGSLLRLHR